MHAESGVRQSVEWLAEIAVEEEEEEGGIFNARMRRRRRGVPYPL